MPSRCSGGRWTLIAFPSSLFHDCKSITPTNRSLHPTWVQAQSNCNVHTNWPQSARYFWMLPLDVIGWKHKQVWSVSIPVLLTMDSGRLLVLAPMNEITLKVCRATVYTACWSVTQCCLKMLSLSRESIQLCSTDFVVSTHFSPHLSNTHKKAIFYLLMQWVLWASLKSCFLRLVGNLSSRRKNTASVFYFLLTRVNFKSAFEECLIDSVTWVVGGVHIPSEAWDVSSGGV